ncbi:MAG: hypothetical protein JXA97_03865 [Anaerolineales bacterium]|nr:hypothetical protein [Anaerolineales bacterium]
MFDSLREMSNGTPEIEDQDELAFEYEEPIEEGPSFLGMKPAQRLILALMIFAVVAVMGTTCLVVTERLWIF